MAAYFDGSWGGFGGTSVAAPTNAGLFADTNQGCFNRLGRVGPALYAADSNANFTDITTGNNDFTGTHGGEFQAGPGYDAASGLGTPVDQNLAIALQGANGCPSVASVSPNTGPHSGGGAITISGGGFAQCERGDVRLRRHRPDRRPVREFHLRDPAQRPGPTVRRRHRAELAGDLGHLGGRPLRLRRRPQLRPGLPLRRLRRRHLRLRRRHVLGQHGQPPPQRTRRGHGRHAEHQRLLAGGLRRRHLQLRRREVLRLHGRAAPEPAHRGHGVDRRRERLLAGGVRRRHLQLRQRARSSGPPAPCS